MPRLPMMALCALLSAASLTGCSRLAPMLTEVLRVQPPQAPLSLRQCLPRPDPPTGDYTQRDVAAFIVRLDERGEDCASHLQALDDWYVDGGQPEATATIPAAPARR